MILYGLNKGDSMPKDYKNISINHIRRRDRQAEESFIKSLLKMAPYCNIAHIAEDQPFLHVNTFYYDEEKHSIYFHSASEGRFRFNLVNNNKVCFSIAKMGRLLPADVAQEFSVEYESVIVFGEVKIINDNLEAKVALQKLLDKYFPHLKPDTDYRSTTDKELKRTAVYQLLIDKWSGKAKKEDIDFKGAFFYGEGNVMG